MLNRYCGICLAALVSFTPIFSQKKSVSPYQVSTRKDLPLLATGLGLSLSGTFAPQDPPIVFREEGTQSGVSVKHLLGLEKSTVSSLPSGSTSTSDWLARGAFLIPLTLLTDADMRNDAGKLSVLYSETLLLTNGLTLFTRQFPAARNSALGVPELPLDENLIPRGQLTFFASQTSLTASLSFCTAKIWSDYHPESKWKPLVWGAAAVVPAATGYFQYRAGDRNFKDLAVGYAMGALVGYLVPQLHKFDHRAQRKIRFSSSLVNGTPVFMVRGLL